MRESKRFDKRTTVLKSDEPRKKFFLFFEGEKTEMIYFDAVRQKKDEIGINPLIELRQLVCGYSERTSNPKKMLENLLKTLDAHENGNITYRMLIDEMTEIYKEKFPNKSKKELFNMFWDICDKKLLVNLEKKVESISKTSAFILDILKEEISLKINLNCITSIPEIEYEDGFDRICMIVDRDKHSFNENQYNEVVHDCKKNNIDFYITNPCFEFWLYMHFETAGKLCSADKKLISDNNRLNKKRTYIEDVLIKEFEKHNKKYNKNRYDAEWLLKSINTAIINEAKFCEDTEKLKDEIGSNIGMLIKELREQ